MMFKNIILLLLLCSFHQTILSQTSTDTFTVMAWNILHGARDIENGVDHAISIIKELDPDIICMVETYGSGQRIAEELNYNFHLVAAEGTAKDDRSINLSVFSKFPLTSRIDTHHPFYLGGIRVNVMGLEINVLSNWFHYLPWEDQPENLGLSVAELLAWEKTETRIQMIQNVLPFIDNLAQQTDSIPLILAGDMNTYSHLDWHENTKDQHNGLIVPWRATKILEELGLRDSFREIHPDPNTKPGITWDQKGRRDEHRIDYVYYKGHQLRAIDSQTYNAFLGDEIRIGKLRTAYPSDHGIVLTTFEIKK